MQHLSRFVSFYSLLSIAFFVLTSFSCTTTFNGRVLVGFSYKKFTVADWLDCLGQCVMDTKCFSYNYKFEGLSCELNNCGFQSLCHAENGLIKENGIVFQQLSESETESICPMNKPSSLLPTKKPEKQEILLYVSCSQRIQVYIDGILVRPPEYHSCFLNATFIIRLNTRPRLIALTGADDTRGQPGLVASIDSVVTDTSWKCASVNVTGWENNGFDDRSWSNAVSYCNNSEPRWPLVKAKGVSSEAEWIWVAKPEVNRKVYCRKTLTSDIAPFQ